MELDDNVLGVCMEHCIDIALRAGSEVGRPLVGAMVATEDGRIVGEGHKQLLSGTKYVQHAERVALDLADELAKGNYLFTTLEPCTEKLSRAQTFCSCSRLIVDRGIKKVIVGLLDNSPSMKPGSGIAYLRDAGVEVILYDAYRERIIHELMPQAYAWHSRKML